MPVQMLIAKKRFVFKKPDHYANMMSMPKFWHYVILLVERASGTTLTVFDTLHPSVSLRDGTNTTSSRLRQGNHPKPKPKPLLLPRPILLVDRVMLWTALPILTLTVSNAASGDWMNLVVSSCSTNAVHSVSGSIRFQAIVTWKYLEKSRRRDSILSTFLLFRLSFKSWSSIGPSPSAPVYRPGWPLIWAASLHACSRWLSSSWVGLLMLRTRNHRLRWKLGTHFRFRNSQSKLHTADRRSDNLSVSRNASLSSVLICSVRESDTWRGSGAPSSDRRDGTISGIGNLFTRFAFWSSSDSLTCWIRLCRVSDSACVGIPRTR